MAEDHPKFDFSKQPLLARNGRASDQVVRAACTQISPSVLAERANFFYIDEVGLIERK